MGAPNALRGGSHIGSLGAAEAVSAGVCDALCSDYHHPSLLHAAFALAARGSCPLPVAWHLVSAGPAAAAGLHDRGRIAPGLLADLVLVEPGPVPRVRGVWVGGREVARCA
jgi:alpha-D-ribose 1-methylphosphonate 5-triphosphate diphosphatase